jgi:uncharacterized protein
MITVHKRYPKNSWWISCLFLAPSCIHGLGVFTGNAIAEGTVIIRWGGVVFTEHDRKVGMVRQETYVGIDDGMYLANPPEIPPSLDDHINHSCDSNLWMLDEITLVSRSRIAAGDELTADYALWLNIQNSTIITPCHCGSKSCRRTITGQDWKKSKVQKRYARHFSPFINNMIKASEHPN